MLWKGLMTAGMGLGKLGQAIGKTIWAGAGVVTGGHQISGIAGGLNNYTRVLVPGAILGGMGIAMGGYKMIDKPYSMYGDRVAWGYTPGAAMRQPSRSSTMSFRGYDSSGLAFALWNLRKR